MNALRRAANRGLWVKPGHYYSPIPSQRDVQRPTREPFGIDLRHDQQAALADQLDLTLAPGRWQEPNNMFGQPDAGTYHAMLERYRPRRVLEVGSGFSTAVALDCLERHRLEAQLTCVEPFPQRLEGLMKPGDRLELIRQAAQDVPLEVFTTLEPRDFLFIDSTHVVKTGSDVVFLLLHVIPRLASGVIVHVHDIHWPFTYPKRWLEEGRAWNEAYLLQALMLEPALLKVLLWGSYLAANGQERFKGAGSIWLERT